ncbi:MAG TPA: xanthine dehydrogenase family protein molybdopterin-binding subunit [Desulfotignum sp.]|nr:xanthine dehydrogenase family protein molybdopterin-binding subunit [Desulfotignum sp.]
MKDYTVVGQRVPKLDAAQKAMGRAEYIQDVRLPGMLYGKILYSSHAHAKITAMDISKARALPGVHAVLTGKDIPPKMRMGFYKDNPPLKADKVCCFRDEIAAVAAVSEEVAKKAVSLIEVEYEPLPAVFDPEAAMEKDAPLVHEAHKGNVLKLPWKLHYGDVAAAEKESAFVAEDRFTTTWVTHCCLSTSGAVALFDASDNLTVYSNTQIPSLAQKDFLETLGAMGLKGKRVRVIKPVIGGGFGSKLDTYAYEHIAILLAHKCRKPVKILFDRKEEFEATSTRQPTVIYIRQGCDKEGHLTFRDIRMVLDNGGRTSWGATTPTVMMMPITSLYRVPNVRYDAKCVYTNNTYAQAMRGYGNPQATFAIESCMDMLAQKAGIDPVMFRRINQNEPGDETPQGFKITSCGLGQCIDAVEKELTADSPLADGEGIGYASLIHVGGGARIYKSDGCGAILKMDDFGKVDIFTGGTDMGQGLDNMIAQIVAEELGLLAEDINVKHSDTDVCPWDVGAHASRSTFVAGNAALGAARRVKQTLLAFGAQLFDVTPEDLVMENRTVFVKNDPEKTMPVDKLLRKAHFSPGGTMLMADYFYDPPNENMGKDFKCNLSVSYSFGVHGVRVQVDKETGKIQVKNYVAAHDVGRAINPMLLEGQVYGGVIMGLGYALSEEVMIKDGQIKNPNFRDYKLFTAKDAVPITAPVIETHDPDGPFGAKGIGEPGCVPTAPAVANAIYNAVGVRIKDLPITPERVLAAIKERQ